MINMHITHLSAFHFLRLIMPYCTSPIILVYNKCAGLLFLCEQDFVQFAVFLANVLFLLHFLSTAFHDNFQWHNILNISFTVPVNCLQ